MARTRTSSNAELLVQLRRDDGAPLHHQLEQELRAAVRSGRLAPGSVLPSTRGLASQLGLSRGVVVEAYEQLVAEGYLTSQRGGATRIAERVTGQAPPATDRPADAGLRIDFAYGSPDVTQFPRAAWLRSLRRVLNEAPSVRLGYLDARGSPEVRDALAAYLNRVRGTAAQAERMIVTNGYAQALTIVMQALKERGVRRIGLEDPGQGNARYAARVHGLEWVSVPVDDRGAVVEPLVRSRAEAVFLTPAHQYPTGAVLSPERRGALVRWATERNAVILEDDFDAEYRYDREPIGAIQGLAPEHVIYAGSASKTLAPGLRLGWLIAPDGLVRAIAEIKEATDRGSPSLEQLAFADFLARGEFDHHLRHMRPIYRARRDVLLGAIRRYLPALEPSGASAGLHVIAWLPPGLDEAALTERAAARGVGIHGLARHYDDPIAARPGLLFGYGHLAEAEIEEGIRILASALD